MDGPQQQPRTSSDGEGLPPPPTPPAGDAPPLLRELWATGAWRLFPLLLVYMSGERAEELMAASRMVQTLAAACMQAPQEAGCCGWSVTCVSPRNCGREGGHACPWGDKEGWIQRERQVGSPRCNDPPASPLQASPCSSHTSLASSQTTLLGGAPATQTCTARGCPLMHLPPMPPRAGCGWGRGGCSGKGLRRGTRPQRSGLLQGGRGSGTFEGGHAALRDARCTRSAVPAAVPFAVCRTRTATWSCGRHGPPSSQTRLCLSCW